jgi:hypothetical protein
MKKKNENEKRNFELYVVFIFRNNSSEQNKQFFFE